MNKFEGTIPLPILEKIKRGQRYINTNLDLSEWGYVKHQMRGTIQKWENVEKRREGNRRHNEEQFRKGGKYYEKWLELDRTGLRGERNKVRGRHQKRWRDYKKIIAPGSQLHHQWQPGTAEYDGVALVERDQHMHGIIKVIQILKGVITVFTEKEIREEKIGYVIE
jgi:hypothetical protein